MKKWKNGKIANGKLRKLEKIKLDKKKEDLHNQNIKCGSKQKKLSNI